MFPPPAVLAAPLLSAHFVHPYRPSLLSSWACIQKLAFLDTSLLFYKRRVHREGTIPVFLSQSNHKSCDPLSLSLSGAARVLDFFREREEMPSQAKGERRWKMAQLRSRFREKNVLLR